MIEIFYTPMSAISLRNSHSDSNVMMVYYVWNYAMVYVYIYMVRVNHYLLISLLREGLKKGLF